MCVCVCVDLNEFPSAVLLWSLRWGRNQKSSSRPLTAGLATCPVHFVVFVITVAGIAIIRMVFMFCHCRRSHSSLSSSSGFPLFFSDINVMVEWTHTHAQAHTHKTTTITCLPPVRQISNAIYRKCYSY